MDSMIVVLIENGVSTMYETNASVKTIRNEFEFSYSVNELVKNIEECNKTIERTDRSDIVDLSINFDGEGAIRYE